MRSHEEWHRKAAELLRCGHAVQRRAGALEVVVAKRLDHNLGGAQQRQLGEAGPEVVVDVLRDPPPLAVALVLGGGSGTSADSMLIDAVYFSAE